MDPNLFSRRAGTPLGRAALCLPSGLLLLFFRADLLESLLVPFSSLPHCFVCFAPADCLVQPGSKAVLDTCGAFQTVIEPAQNDNNMSFPMPSAYCRWSHAKR